MPVEGDIDFYKGNDRALRLEMPSGSDITGWTTQLLIKGLDGTTQITKSGVFVDTRHADFTLLSADTSSLTVGPYNYEMARIDSGHQTTLRLGRFNLLQEQII